MKKNKSGYSILIGMSLVVLISLSSYVILSYIIPFAKNTKGLDNGVNAYYNGVSGIEEGLYSLKTRNSLTEEFSSKLGNTQKGYEFQTFSSGNLIPNTSEGNSEYDKNFNTISFQEPLQMEIGNGSIKDLENFKITIKTPQISSGNNYLSGADLPILNWVLSSDENSLFASSGSFIKNNDINSNLELKFSDNKFKNGINLDGIVKTFQSYYDENCVSSSCILKISVLNSLQNNNGVLFPYLEYKIDSGNNNIPLRYFVIKSVGNAYGYSKNIKLFVPQKTVNQAFDFTVFQ